MIRWYKFTWVVAGLLLSHTFATAQVTIERTIVWNRPYQLTSRPAAPWLFDFEGAILTPETMAPIFQEVVEVTADISMVTISDLHFQPLSETECKAAFLMSDRQGTDSTAISFGTDSLVLHVRQVSFDGGTRAFISFLPVRKSSTTGQYEKLMRFTLRVFSREIDTPKSNIKNQAVFESVLASGRWYKFSIKETGIYRINYDDLRSAGLDPAGINPRNLRLFGYGGGMLPESNAEPRPDDLTENSILVVGEEDGQFNAQDYILFYGVGPDRWRYNQATGQFNYQAHLYSDQSYYYITADKGFGKRVAANPSAGSSPGSIVTIFDEYQAYEKNEVNLIKSGREWYGEIFETSAREFIFNVPNLVKDSAILISTVLAARSFTPSSFAVDVNGSAGNVLVGSVSSSNAFSDFAREVTAARSVFSASDQLKVKISYNRTSSPASGWLNRIVMQGKRQLNFTGDKLQYRSIQALEKGRVLEYRLLNVTGAVQVWDVAEASNAKIQQVNLSGTTFWYRVVSTGISEYIAFDPSKALKPAFVERVTNQNLHGFTTPDMVIVTHPNFLQQAQRLADFRESSSGLNVKVVTTNQIYNEFSSGSQDISAIRDFLKMLYERSTAQKSLRYLLLFGDASYDYKNRIKTNTNFVPSWQSPNSLHYTDTYATDDFFGFLENHEGAQITDDVDIGIGRLPVTTVQEATNIVDKIIRYSTLSPANQGDWRNMICFVADDEDDNLHVDQAERLVKQIENGYNAYNFNKIYLDAFQQVRTSGGQRYPVVNQEINKRISRGALVVNYTGHGGVNGWALERVLELSDIKSWSNGNRLPLFITATCEFTYFDDPEFVSAGEHVILNPNGGAIALYTTTRPTYSSDNFILNQRVYQNLFRKEKGQAMTLGDVIRLAKQKLLFYHSHKFILIGDPALTLNIPAYGIETTHINNTSAGGSSDTLKALSKITIKGRVHDQSGNTLNNFNGELSPTIFDKPVQAKTLANDGGNVFSFNTQQSILHKGRTSVKNGLFEFSLLVPKDIAYQVGNGKISYYAFSDQSDAHGTDMNIKVGGFATNVSNDTKGPAIQMFINDINFKPGGKTHENPILYALINDESGINTTGTGIGHDIVAILDDRTDKPYVLNDFYVSELDTTTKGAIVFPFYNLSEGKHELRLKAWDVHNNSSEATIEFVVVNQNSLLVEKVFNYPNPFSHNTHFMIEHNQAGNKIDIEIQIYSFEGKLKRLFRTTEVPAGYRSIIYDWDGLDERGHPLPAGIYIYRAVVTNSAGKSAQTSNKLIIVR